MVQNLGLVEVPTTSKPRLANYKYAAGERVPADPQSILEAITLQTQGWPIRVGSQLYRKSQSGQLECLRSDNELFAWLFEHFRVDWASKSITKAEFFEYCHNNAERFDFASDFPHFPPLPKVKYLHQKFKHDQGKALKKFLNLLSPASEHDRQLLKAFIMTLFWGGPLGQRPAFVFTSLDNDPEMGRGVGKTTTVDLCTRICGGYLSHSHIDKGADVKTRVLNQANGRMPPRVNLFDNVKTRRFSSADIEALITASTIDGHVLYKGNGGIPNYLIFAMTINGASLSKDMAQRSIVIKLKRPVYDPSWIHTVETFINKHTWTIIGDILREFQKPAQQLEQSTSSRWAHWEHEIIDRLDAPEKLRGLISKRQAKVDDDDANQAELLAHLQETLSYGHTSHVPGCVVVTHATLHKSLKDFEGQNFGRNAVKKYIDSSGLKCIRQFGAKGKPRRWLFKLNGEPFTADEITLYKSKSTISNSKAQESD